MDTNIVNISNIRRPKLIMSAAKELVHRRKKCGRCTKEKDIEMLAAKEFACEELRITRSMDYSVDDHIRCLADMIEYFRDNQKILEIA